MTMQPFKGRCHTCGHDHDAETLHWRDVLDLKERADDKLRAEIERLKHNEMVMMDALYKACGDDEEIVRQTISSQGDLLPMPPIPKEDE